MFYALGHSFCALCQERCIVFTFKWLFAILFVQWHSNARDVAQCICGTFALGSRGPAWLAWCRSHFLDSAKEKNAYYWCIKLTFKLQRTTNKYAAKRRIYKRPDQQKYTLSRHTEFCKADRTTWKLTLQDINTTLKEPKQSGVIAVDSRHCRVDVLQS